MSLNLSPSYFDQPLSRSHSLSRVSSSRVKKNISNYDLSNYLISLAILNYRSQPIFKYNHGTLTPKTSISSTTTSKPKRIRPFSYSGHELRKWSSGETTHTHQRFDSVSYSQKLSGQIITDLCNTFKGMAPVGALGTDGALRTCYFAYYNELLKVGDHILIEGYGMDSLVTLFIDTVEKQLSLNRIVDPEKLAIRREEFCANFIDLLIDVVKHSSGYLARIKSSNKNLIRQLESLKSNLSTTDLDKYTQSSIHDDMISNHSLENQTPPPTSDPSFQINDMIAAQEIASILSMTKADIQKQIDSIKFNATEKLAVDELKAIQIQLRNANEHHMYKREDFNNDSEYEYWKEHEIDAIEQKIVQYQGAVHFNYNIFSLPLSPSPDENPAFYIPNYTTSYYRHLVKLCLERDLKLYRLEQTKGSKVIQVFLTKSSQDLMNKVALMWRIPYITKALILLDVSIEMFRTDDFTLNTIYEAFELAKQFVGQSQWKWIPETWPYCDRVDFIMLLNNLRQIIIEKIKTALSHVYDKRTPKILQYSHFIDNYILCYKDLEEEAITKGEISFQGPFPSNDQIKDFKKVIIQAALNKYDLLIAKVPRDCTLNFQHISYLAENLLEIVETLEEKYDSELFNRINIPKISCKNQFTVFSMDCGEMFHYIVYYLQHDNDPPFTVMSELYKNLASIRDLSNVFESRFEFDIEANCYPFVEDWVESCTQNTYKFVENAVQADNFISIKSWLEQQNLNGKEEERIDNFHSRSIIETFQIFHSNLKLVNDLRWRNDVQRAKIITTTIRGISDSICQYANISLKLFSDELKREELENPQNRLWQEQEYTRMVKTLINGKRRSSIHHYVEETWVKVNNIEYSINRLHEIQNEVNPEKIFECLKEADIPQQAPSSYSFNITIVRAEGIKPCDFNGLSDPYVVLVDPKTEKEICRTETIYKTLNPVWNQTFKIRTMSNRSVTACIWDANLFQSSKLCGTTSIQLNPAEFENFIPKEISYDISLDSESHGKLIISVSMECKGDDIIYYFKKSLGVLRRTQKQMIDLIIGKLTPFIQYCLSLQTMNNLVQHKPATNMNILPQWLNNKWTEQAPKQKKTFDELKIMNELGPLFDFLNDNFITLANCLTTNLRQNVLMETWKVVVETIDQLLKSGTNLTPDELEITITWLQGMRDFFHHDGKGPSLEELQDSRYWALMEKLM